MFFVLPPPPLHNDYTDLLKPDPVLGQLASEIYFNYLIGICVIFVLVLPFKVGRFLPQGKILPHRPY